MRKKTKELILASVSFVLFWGAGCSGDRKPSTLTEGLLTYQEGQSVSFSISGVASCDLCAANELPVIGAHMEVIPKADPTHSLGLKSVDGLGPFTIADVRAEPGAILLIIGTLYLGGNIETTAITGYAEILAPPSDGDVVAFTMEFPSAKK